MEIVKFTLNENDVPSRETLTRIDEGYALAQKSDACDEENPPLTIKELYDISSRVKKQE